MSYVPTLKHHHRSYAATVDREEACVACGRGGNHPLGSCGKLQGMMCEEHCEVMKKGVLCKNCLKPGHIASKCRLPSMCKRCHKYHHTLLHIKADTKKQLRTKVSKETVHVASLKRGGEVLLMTCWVKVIAPDGTVVQVIALLNSAASASRITEWLAKRLWLPRYYSNSKISGAAGIGFCPKGGANFKEASVLLRSLPTYPLKVWDWCDFKQAQVWTGLLLFIFKWKRATINTEFFVVY